MFKIFSLSFFIILTYSSIQEELNEASRLLFGDDQVQPEKQIVYQNREEQNDQSLVEDLNDAKIKTQKYLFKNFIFNVIVQDKILTYKIIERSEMPQEQKEQLLTKLDTAYDQTQDLVKQSEILNQILDVLFKNQSNEQIMNTVSQIQNDKKTKKSEVEDFLEQIRENYTENSKDQKQEKFQESLKDIMSDESKLKDTIDIIKNDKYMKQLFDQLEESKKHKRDQNHQNNYQQNEKNQQKDEEFEEYFKKLKEAINDYPTEEQKNQEKGYKKHHSIIFLIFGVGILFLCVLYFCVRRRIKKTSKQQDQSQTNSQYGEINTSYTAPDVRL